MSPPEPPGIPGRHLPGRTRLPPPKDPRGDSGGSLPILIPEQPPVARFEAAPVSRKESVFSALKPDRWAINVAFVLASLGIGGGSAIALNRPAPAPQFECATKADFETEKALRIQRDDLTRIQIKRQKHLETLVGAAFARGACLTRQKNGRTEQVCGGIKLEGFPGGSQAEITSESIGERPVFKVELNDDRTTPGWPEQ